MNYLSSSLSTYDFRNPAVTLLGAAAKEKDRRRSLDIGVTDEFFSEPKNSNASLASSVNSSSTVGSEHKTALRKEMLMAGIEQCKRLLKQNQSNEQLKGM